MPPPASSPLFPVWTIEERPAPARRWWQRRTARPTAWEVSTAGPGRHLLVTGLPGSGCRTYCNALVRQAVAQGAGALVFDARGSCPENARAVFEEAVQAGREAETVVFDWSEHAAADPWFERPFQEAVAARRVVLVVLVALPSAETQAAAASAALATALGWVRNLGRAEMAQGRTAVLMPDTDRLFNGLNHRAWCDALAQRCVSALFRMQGLALPSGYPQACWWFNLLEPLAGAVVFKTFMPAAFLEAWAGPGAGHEPPKNTLALAKGQAWASTGEAWERLDAPAPESPSTSARFEHRCEQARAEALSAPNRRAAERLGNRLLPTKIQSVRPRL